MTFRSSLGALLFALALGACGGSSSSTTTSETTTTTTTTTETAGAESATVVDWRQATIGDRSTCPVSGEEYTITDASPHVEHEGHTYYFCCPHCAERFQANPDQFLTPAEPAPAS